MTNPSAGVSEATPYSPTTDVPAMQGFLKRVAAVDVLRGIVVILMAIDHVRVFSAVPAGGPDPGVFFTRWITNFVAPVFVFLAGTGAYLYGRKVRDMRALAKFLVTRGLLLILLELTVIRISWTFNLDYGTYLLAGVIWVIGWSMVVLAGLVFLPTKAVGAFGVAMIFLHNIVPWIETNAWLPKVLYYGGDIKLGANGVGPSLVILYVLVPWVGVMAAGYAFGTLYDMDPARRRRLLFRLGGAAIALFVILRATGVYGDPGAWKRTEGAWTAVRTFLGTAKYPASLQFLLMTLGPAFLLLPPLERAKNRVTDALEVFGRVPMFYYLLHIPLIHALACVVSLIRTGSVPAFLFSNFPMWPAEPPAGYPWSLALLYLVTAIAVALLYPACRWYARVKATSPRPWMKFI